MTAYLRCPACGAVGTARGRDEPDVNAFELTGDPEWAPAAGTAPRLLLLRHHRNGEDTPPCPHDDFEITSTEYEEFDEP